MQLIRDGVSLFFEDSGSGGPPLVFVHGWCCDHTYFAPQVEYFRRTHRVVAVDLRGHGQSDQPQQAYTMGAFADDVVWLCAQLRIEKPVIIGHSMGGVIALVLAAEFPGVPAAIVSVDSPILFPPSLPPTLQPFLQALRGPNFRAAQQQFTSDMLFMPSDDAARKARIIDAMGRAPQHVMASAFEGILGFDHAAAVAACRVPWLALYAAQVTSDLARMRELCPQVVTGQTVGAGHFHQLEVPEQVNAMLARFLAVALPQ
ncbi:MAG: alpha/beta hydrolase [Deltaproteobacteria bacterium]|nr:alpha/beta hydrolase [Deltaproteobacteria bacterium]MBI3389526.1 alpha/beta hydrolase [Deltaproteobacteria bacterium]